MKFAYFVWKHIFIAAMAIPLSYIVHSVSIAFLGEGGIARMLSAVLVFTLGVSCAFFVRTRIWALVFIMCGFVILNRLSVDFYDGYLRPLFLCGIVVSFFLSLFVAGRIAGTTFVRCQREIACRKRGTK